MRALTNGLSLLLVGFFQTVDFGVTPDIQGVNHSAQEAADYKVRDKNDGDEREQRHVRSVAPVVGFIVISGSAPVHKL